jgi:Asp-tRNA(Asn)/Glu-tRNA(Gln) amidotransferase A subunit family amidase
MLDQDLLSRKQFVKGLLLTAAATAIPMEALAQDPDAPAPPAPDEVTLEDLKAMERIAGISFTDEERKSLLKSVISARQGFEAVRKEPIDWTTEPATVFTPLGGGSIPNAPVSAVPSAGPAIDPRRLSDEDIAFLSVRQLGHLIRTRRLSPVRLTEIYLERLERHGPDLQCVATLTPDLARRQARQAEREIAAGRYRGPLHGIPYGLKDLFATKGIPTEWGAAPFEGRIYDFDATVVERLEAAGAILIAKLTLGALAMGDVWSRGVTKNPWNPQQGSSGSSAGSSAATAAGLVAFAIGTETSGSILSPAQRCRVTALRPTYGRVSRYGGMALSYTMDKVGPICREVEDCALVLAAICGSDPKDPSAVDRPFEWPAKTDPRKLKVGYLAPSDPEKPAPEPAEDPFLKALASRGVQLAPIRFTPAPAGLFMILGVEASSAFDAFTRGEEIKKLKNSAWPDSFRANRYVPAVEYLQAQRARTLMMRRFEEEFGEFDAFIANGIGEYTFMITNLTGHPVVSIPNGVDRAGNGASKVIVGRLYGEDRLLALAKLAQEAGDFHRRRPTPAHPVR